MSAQDRAQALRWYVQGFDLVTIAQHYRMTTEELAQALRVPPHGAKGAA